MIWLSSCATTQEELWIEPDGSGRFVSTTDISAMYPFLMMGMMQEEEDEEEEQTEGDATEPKDAMDMLMENLLKQEKVDTVISLSGMMKEELPDGKTLEMMIDSMKQVPASEQGVTEEQKKMGIRALEGMMDLKMRLQASQPEQMLKFSTIQDFTEVEDFSNFGDMIEEMGQMMGESPSGDAISDMMGSGTTSFSIDGKVLQISRKGMDMGELGEGEEAAETMAMMQMFMGDEPYRLTIHFPGKVKKVKSEYAERVDKRTVVIEIPQEKLYDPEFEFNLDVKFKGLK